MNKTLNKDPLKARVVSESEKKVTRFNSVYLCAVV